MIRFTLITKDTGLLSKRISFNNGTVKKDSSSCWLNRGTAQVIEIPFESLPDFLDGLQTNQAVVWGVPDGIYPGEEVPLVSRALVDGHQEAITRTKDVFHYPESGVLMFDYDPPAGATALTPDELMEAIRALSPDLANVAMVHRNSASSPIFDLNCTELIPLRNQRVYVQYGGSPELINAWVDGLVYESWRQGHGYIFISKAGTMLERTLFDTAVFSPERLDFAGPPDCHDCQHTYTTSFHPGDPVFFNPAEINYAELKKLITKEKKKSEAKAKRVRKKYISQRVEKGEDARPLYILAEKNILSPGVKIFFDDGEVADVGDILSDPGRYDGKTCADPLEPEYGKGKAKIFVNDDDDLVINSFAHGGRQFFLHASLAWIAGQGNPLELLETYKDKIVEFTVSEQVGFQKQMKEEGLNKSESTKFLREVKKEAKEKEKGNQNLTHAEMAEIMALEYYGDADIYTSADKLYVYNGRTYLAKDLSTVRSTMIKLFDGQLRCSTESHYKAVTKCFYERYKENTFDNSYRTLILRDGVYQVRNGELRRYNHSPEFRTTDYLDVVPSQKKPTRLLEFLEWAIPEDVDLFQEILGSTLLSTLSIDYHKAVLLLGSGLNGKSMLLNVIKGLFPPDKVVAVSPYDWSKAESRIQLVDKSLNIVPELDRGRAIPDGAFKAVVSGDEITVRNLFNDPTTRRITCSHFFASNHIPKLNDSSMGMRRRWLMIEFKNKVKDPKPRYENYILEQKAEIIGWGLEGLGRLLARGGFEERNVDRMFSDVDEFALFIKDREWITVVRSGKVKLAKLYSAYLQWRTESGYNRRKVSFLNKTRFEERLLDEGYDIVKEVGGVNVNGIKLEKVL